MTKIGRLVGVLAMLGGAAFAAEKAKTSAAPQLPQMTTEQRNKMADAHEKMAACLRSDRPLTDCHDEMMKSCQETMGTSTCPMMGMGPMRGHGRWTPPSGSK